MGQHTAAGVDQRTKDESCRSDTMIICSINTQTAEVKLASLMRDIAVDYDDLGAHNGTYRLNAANYFGGPELAMKTINELLGLNIQNTFWSTSPALRRSSRRWAALKWTSPRRNATRSTSTP